MVGMAQGIELGPPSLPRFGHCCGPHPPWAAVPRFDLKTPMGEEICLTQISTAFLKVVNVMLKRVSFHLPRPTPGWFGCVTCTAGHKQGEPACLQGNPPAFYLFYHQNSREDEGGLSPAGGRAASSVNFPVLPLNFPVFLLASCSRDAGTQLSTSLPATHPLLLGAWER